MLECFRVRVEQKEAEQKRERNEEDQCEHTMLAAAVDPCPHTDHVLIVVAQLATALSLRRGWPIPGVSSSLHESLVGGTKRGDPSLRARVFWPGRPETRSTSLRRAGSFVNEPEFRSVNFEQCRSAPGPEPTQAEAVSAGSPPFSLTTSSRPRSR